jgi:hypothetical protein
MAMPNKYAEVTPRNFNPMWAPGLSDETRKAMNAACCRRLSIDDQGCSEGLGVRVGIDAGLAARCRQACIPSEGTTQAASSLISLEPAILLLLGCSPTCCILSVAA